MGREITINVSPGDNFCRICGNQENNSLIIATEMMFGLGGEFRYLHCDSCGCLQLNDIPTDMAGFYPKDYYSFTSRPSLKTNNIYNLIRNLRDSYSVFNKNLLGKLIYHFFPNEYLRIYARLKLAKDTRILDVGCGSGLLLNNFKAIGFINLLGIDPFNERDMHSAEGVKILKRTIHQVGGEWDLIMFHHSFEHLPDPLESLCSCARMLSPQGVCLIRTPVTDSWSWQTYRQHWAQLDAPRHFYIFSQKSMKIIASKAGLNLKDFINESTIFQFWASEQFKKGIPLKSASPYSGNPEKTMRSEELKSLTRKAEELKRKNLGDQTVFFLIRQDNE